MTRTRKMLPHEWAAAQESNHHRLLVQITDSNGTRRATGSWSHKAQAIYLIALYEQKGATGEIVESQCTWNCRQCQMSVVDERCL